MPTTSSSRPSLFRCELNKVSHRPWCIVIWQPSTFDRKIYKKLVNWDSRLTTQLCDYKAAISAGVERRGGD